jgi:hypothetical protein
MRKRGQSAPIILSLNGRFDHAAFLAWPRLAIAIASTADKSREPPARNDLVHRVILETEEEAGSPRSAQRASASVMVYDAVIAIAVTAATDLVALVPRRYAEACANSTQIRIVDFPRDHAEMIEFSMLWHSRVHDDPGSLWLRALIREAVNLSSDPLRPWESVNRTSASASAGEKAKRYRLALEALKPTVSQEILVTALDEAIS